MNVDVAIVGILQRMDLATNAVSNMLELALPDGSHLTAPITEADTQKILQLAIRAEEQFDTDTGFAPEAYTPPARVPFAQDDVRIFGGDEQVTKSDTPNSMQELQELLARGASTQQARAATRLSEYRNKDGTVTPIRTISSVDDAGNPILPGVNNSNPVADSGYDEDGVPSV